MEDIETIILNNLANNEQFCRKAMPFIKTEYFQDSHKAAYDIFREFMVKYNKLPTATALTVEFQESKYCNRADANEIGGIIRDLGANKEVDLEWLTETTEKWCKDRAIHNAIMESIQIIDGSNEEKGEGLIPQLLSDALGVSFDSNIGHDYIEGAKDRYDFYHMKTSKIAFDLEKLNEITKGGVTRKTLNVILAGTGCGKSLAMCHMAAANLAEGKSVLYITMEMAEERIAERIDANLFDVPIDQIDSMSEDKFTAKVSKIGQKTEGKLIIKEYPTASAHVGHFRALLNELKMKKDFKPDVIYVDYLNICASSRIKGLSGSVNTYSLIKSIAEELRGLAVEFNVPIWSATQVTRGGFGNTDVEITDTSESFGLPATCDLMIALITSEQLEGMNQIMVKQLKNRYNDVTENKRFVLGIDRSKMRLYDVEEDAQTLSSEIKTTTNESGNDFASLKV